MIKDTSQVMEPETARNNPPINTQVMARDEAGDRVPMITDVGMPTITNTTVVGRDPVRRIHQRLVVSGRRHARNWQDHPGPTISVGRRGSG